MNGNKCMNWYKVKFNGYDDAAAQEYRAMHFKRAIQLYLDEYGQDVREGQSVQVCVSSDSDTDLQGEIILLCEVERVWSIH